MAKLQSKNTKLRLVTNAGKTASILRKKKKTPKQKRIITPEDTTIEIETEKLSKQNKIKSSAEKIVERLEKVQEKIPHKKGKPRQIAQIKALEAEIASLRKDLSELILEADQNNPYRRKSTDPVSTIGTDFKSQLGRAVFKRVLGYRKLKSPRALIETDINTNPATNEVDEFGRDYKFEAKLKPLFDFFYYKYWRVQTYGLNHIPSKGRGLIVANHSGTLPFDGPMIRLAINNDHPARRSARFLVEDFVYYMPFLGTFMYRVGGVRACQENAERLLDKDYLVAVFPEGVKGIGKKFDKRYQLQRFGRGGFIRLAIRTGSPIIPVAVIGAEETHPLLYKSYLLSKPFGIPYVPFTPTLPFLGPLGFFGLPCKWHLHFGKPISFDKYGKKALEDDLLIHRLSEEVRGTIQNMIKEGLKQRRGIFFD